MLEEPRELDERAPLPLPPLKALLPPRELEGEALRLPTRSPPPPPPPEKEELPPERLLAPPPDERLLAEPPAPDDLLLALARSPLRLLCWRDCAPADRDDAESPRAEPPYLLAVALSLYGAPPRCAELCCQLPLPLRLPWLFLTLLFLT